MNYAIFCAVLALGASLYAEAYYPTQDYGAYNLYDYTDDDGTVYGKQVSCYRSTWCVNGHIFSKGIMRFEYEPTLGHPSVTYPKKLQNDYFPL